MFTSAHLKIKRAYRHIDELESAVAEYATSDKHRIVKKTDGGRFKVILELGFDLPSEIPLIFGDAIHNLRSALDHMMVAAAKALDHTVSVRAVAFPVRKDLDEVAKALDAKVIQPGMETAAGRRLREIILNEIKPYGHFENPFNCLSELDNIDKHRLIVAIMVVGGSSFTGTIGTSKDSNTVMYSYGGPDGYVLMSTDQEPKGDFKPVFDVRLNEAEFAKNQSLVPLLKNLANVVTQALQAFERCLVVK